MPEITKSSDPRPQATRPEIATTHDVVRAARLLRDAASEPVRHPRVAADWRALATRVEALADSLEALREVVKGCGTVLVADGDESITCGSQECADEPDFCAACTARVWTAIATLTQGDE